MSLCRKMKAGRRNLTRSTSDGRIISSRETWLPGSFYCKQADVWGYPGLEASTQIICLGISPFQGDIRRQTLLVGWISDTFSIRVCYWCFIFSSLPVFMLFSSYEFPGFNGCLWQLDNDFSSISSTLPDFPHVLFLDPVFPGLDYMKILSLPHSIYLLGLHMVSLIFTLYLFPFSFVLFFAATTLICCYPVVNIS